MRGGLPLDLLLQLTIVCRLSRLLGRNSRDTGGLNEQEWHVGSQKSRHCLETVDDRVSTTALIAKCM